MSKSSSLEQIWNQLVQCLDSLATILDSLKEILPAIQNTCVDLLRFEEFGSVSVNLRYECSKLCRQLNKIVYDVTEYIIITKSLRKMADDQMAEIKAIRKENSAWPRKIASRMAASGICVAAAVAIYTPGIAISLKCSIQI